MNRARTNFASPSRNRKSCRGRRGGFTLVEVLATLLMLGIALPAILGGFTAATAAVNSSRRQAEAAGRAEPQLNSLNATQSWQNTTQGTFDGKPDYQWSAQLSNYGNGIGVNATNIVQQLDLQVTWTERTSQKPKSVTVSTLVYQTQNGSSSGSSTSGGAP